MGELPKSPHVGGSSQDMLVGEAGDTIAIINTDITSIFKETRSRKTASANKSRSVDYLPEGLLEMDFQGTLENRRGSLGLKERISSVGRSRTNTMPSRNSTDSMNKPENGKSTFKDDKDSQPIPAYQKSQSLVETIQSPGTQETDLDARTISTPSISIQTPTKSRKISEALMSSWFFQRNPSENDLKSLAEDNNPEENQTEKLTSVKNNVKFSHSDIGDKKTSLSNFVAGNFTARDLRSLNAFVPQST